jgi:asparagine synthase (glutamine-hydrolysing)
MCGIGGIVQLGTATPERRRLERMSEAMRMRGPDDSGIWVGEGAGLVHRRLSILDLSSAGRCPMADDAGAWQLVHNGEIYNFRELRAELQGLGHAFRSDCDSEVILRGYAQWGGDVVERLEGMFAFAIWDVRERSLFLARDRLGEKPLYVFENANGLGFASTLTALRACLGDELTVDAAAIDCYLTHSFIPSHHTAFRGVRALPPAHRATFRPGSRLRTERYWELPTESPRRVRVREAEDIVEHALDRSVKARLIADVPVGGFLSGGVDSSLVMALAARHSSAIDTFSIGFEEADFSELPHARRVAETIGSTHHELIVNEDDLLALVPSLVWHYGQPFGDSSAIPTHLVSRFTRDRVKVALSGDGGDESFAGYWRAEANWYASQYARVLPKAVRERAVPVLCSAMRSAGLGGPAARLGALNHLSLGPAGTSFTDSLSWFNRRDEILGPEFRSALDTHDPAICRTGSTWPGGTSTLLQQVLYDDFQSLLPDDYLVKVDVASMAASLEVRPPFLDHRFVETAWMLPDSLKLRFGARKWLLKRVAARHVPRDIVYRPKSGFALPMVHWWRRKLPPVLRALLHDSRAVEWGWLERAPVESALAAHAEGREQHHVRLWLVLWLELWARILIEGSMSPDTSLLDIL